MRFALAVLGVLAVACGKPGVFASKSFCSGFLETDPAAGLGTELVYQHYVMSDDSVMVWCEAAGQDSSAGFIVYSPNDSGYRDARCVVAFDIDAFSDGLWRFSINETQGTATARYDDPGSQFHNRTASLACTAH